MIDFRIKVHSVRPGVQVVEIWDDEVFIGTITPGNSAAAQLNVRVISKYVDRATIIAGGAVVVMFDVR